MLIEWSEQYLDYLRDESRRMGTADSISFPKSEAEVIEAVKAFSGTITTQGARTGIVAGAVPEGGLILNLSRMNSIGEISIDKSILVQPGAILTDVQNAVESAGLFFPPDPTETSASIGGMAACNASGAKTFLYGPTRDWIYSLRVVLSDGSVVALKRGENFADGRSFSLTTEDGREISGELPKYSMPNVKSASGYYAADGMDMIDLFIGMEGTLGIITEVGLKLIPKPGAVAGLTVFFADEDSAIKFVRAMRGEEVEGLPSLDAKPAAIEFFNHDALTLLRKMKSTNSAFESIPPVKESFHTAVYAEFHGVSDDEIEEAIFPVMEAMAELGVSDDDTWYATCEREMEPIKAFRHAIPEAVNLLIDERKRENPDITKLGTDMSVPDSELEQTLCMYNVGLREAGLESVIFGHIGNNHVHVNILPNSMGDYEKGKALYLMWAKRIIDTGGSISAEHGIGKIKKPFLELAFGPEGVGQMRALKALFDPEMRLNRGDLFD